MKASLEKVLYSIRNADRNPGILNKFDMNRSSDPESYLYRKSDYKLYFIEDVMITSDPITRRSIARVTLTSDQETVAHLSDRIEEEFYTYEEYVELYEKSKHRIGVPYEINGDCSHLVFLQMYGEDRFIYRCKESNDIIDMSKEDIRECIENPDEWLRINVFEAPELPPPVFDKKRD